MHISVAINRASKARKMLAVVDTWPDEIRESSRERFAANLAEAEAVMRAHGLTDTDAALRHYGYLPGDPALSDGALRRAWTYSG